MMTRTTALCTSLACIFLVTAPDVATADGHELLKDASFESQLAPDEGGWTLFDASRYSADVARSGRQSMFNGGLSRTVQYAPFFVGTVSGSYQEFPAEPGSRWRLTGFGYAANAIEGAPAFGIVQVSFFDADGKDLGTVETAGGSAARAKTSNEMNSQTPVGEWVFLDTGSATAPVGATAIHAFTLFVDFSGSAVTQGVYFDDLRLCAISDEDDCAGVAEEN